MKRMILAGVIAVAIATIASPAFAVTNTQTVTASLGSSLSVTTAPTSSVSSWTLASSGANTTSGGSIAVNSNVAYTISVTADKATMSEWDGSAYVNGGKTLTTAMSVIASRSSGTATTPGVAATAVIGTSSTLATGTGLGSDTYSLTLSQPTVITDSALQTNSYHIVLTYTSAAAF
jgi:hypothetical protein